MPRRKPPCRRYPPGDTRTVRAAEVKSDQTKPPAQHNDASLLSAMETAGRESTDEEIARR